MVCHVLPISPVAQKAFIFGIFDVILRESVCIRLDMRMHIALFSVRYMLCSLSKACSLAHVPVAFECKYCLFTMCRALQLCLSVCCCVEYAAQGVLTFVIVVGDERCSRCTDIHICCGCKAVVEGWIGSLIR